MFVDLGKRLACIATQINETHKSNPFDQIWDCCCDHGYLGIALLNHFSAQSAQHPQINFVDQVEHITQQLFTKLSAQANKNCHAPFEVITKDTGKLAFNNKQHHCIIIAGVTTNGMIKQIKQILNSHPQQALEFILCPTRGIYDLRAYLIDKGLSLINEHYVKENNRHYEILHIKNQTEETSLTKEFTHIGEFWKHGNKDHIEYLENRIQHHQHEIRHTHMAESESALRLYTRKHHALNN